jgi:hypothetical protein
MPFGAEDDALSSLAFFAARDDDSFHNAHLDSSPHLYFGRFRLSGDHKIVARSVDRKCSAVRKQVDREENRTLHTSF